MIVKKNLLKLYILTALLLLLVDFVWHSAFMVTQFWNQWIWFCGWSAPARRTMVEDTTLPENKGTSYINICRGGSIGGSSTALQFSKWSIFILQPVQVLFYIIRWTFGFTFYILNKTNITAKFYQGNLTYKVPCYIIP